jgi:nucleotide-binding universal stress UspA family protein
MKNLLAIINDANESKEFIRYVANMAIDLNANVKLLYVQEPFYPIGGAVGATGAVYAEVHQNQEALSTAKEILLKHISDITSILPDSLVINISTEYGNTSLIAKEFVSDKKADMLVLEGQENEGFWEQSSGNKEIISQVECPVLIIPNHAFFKAFTEIIYATDYNEEDITGLKKLLSFAQPFSPNITALHITDNIDFKAKVEQAGFLDMLHKRTNYEKLSVRILDESSNDDIAQLINDYASLINADLIVVLKENKTFFERIFQTDSVKEIIKESMLPVLVFHGKE